MYHTSNFMAILLLYVDEILLRAFSSSLLQKLISRLKTKFSMNNLGPLHYFLGTQIIPHYSSLFLFQHKYTFKLLEHAHMSDSKVAPISNNTHSPLSIKDGATFANPTLYKSIVGDLQYITFTHIDISSVVNLVYQYMHAPTNIHW